MAVADDTTSVALPGRPTPRAESNGLAAVPEAVPEVIEFENTGRMSAAIRKAMESEGSEDLVSEMISVLRRTGDGGGGDDPGEKTLKEIKRHKWLAALMSLFLGSGGMVGSYYALKARAASNTKEVEVLKEAAKTTEPRIENNAKDIRLLKGDVSGINKSVGEMKGQQTTIVDGIEELKNENVKRLKQELKDAKQELTQLRRRTGD